MWHRNCNKLYKGTGKVFIYFTALSIHIILPSTLCYYGGIFYENGNLPQIGNTGVLLSAKPLVPSRTLFKFMEEKLGLASVRNKIRSGIGSPTTNSTRTSGDWISSLSPRPTFSLVLNFSISFRKYNFPGYITIKIQCSLLTMSIVWIVQPLDMCVSLILCVDSV